MLLRRTILAAPLLSTLALGGCATIGGGISVTDVQNAAVAACAYLPTAATVANIIAAGNPLTSTVSAIAQAICAAVAPMKAGRKAGAALPTVNGVVIRGQFVR